MYSTLFKIPSNMYISVGDTNNILNVFKHVLTYLLFYFPPGLFSSMLVL